MDEWMNDLDRQFFGRRNPLYGHHEKNLMKTDVRENENDYEIDVELPGFDRDQLELTLNDGYLTITAEKSLDKEKTEKKTGKIIRQERYSGRLQRSFYVGKDLKEEDITAKLEHGLLKLTVPKVEKKPALPEKHTIAIE